MNLNQAFMLLAGVLLMVFSLLILIPGWFWPAWVILFAGFMFVQAAFTGFCPSKIMLKSLGIKDGKKEE